MSSGPVGLDVREYGFDAAQYTLAGPTRIGTGTKWLVTKIQVYNAATEVLALQLISPSGAFVNNLIVQPSGCLIIEPNGAFRGDVNFISGAGAVVIIEYWYQATADGLVPAVTP